DPKEEIDETWEGFEGSQFRVPTFLLTVEHNTCYLTTTVNVEEADMEQLERELLWKKKQLLSTNTDTFQTNQISLQHEVDPEAWMSSVKKARNTIEEEPVDKIV